MFENTPLGATLPASDIERAKTFYRDKLGLKPIEDNDEGGGVMYETGGARFLVYPSEFAGTNKATAAAWEVDDLDGAVNELKGRGVSFQEFDMDDMTMQNSILEAPDGTRAAWFTDSEGNIIGLFRPASEG